MPDTQQSANGGLGDKAREAMNRPAMTVSQLFVMVGMVLPVVVFGWQLYSANSTANAQAIALQERQTQTLLQMSSQLADQRQASQQFLTQASEMRGIIVELRTQTTVLQRDVDRQREDTDRRFEGTRQSIQQLRDLIARMAMNQPRAQSDQPPISDVQPLPDRSDAMLWWTVMRWSEE